MIIVADALHIPLVSDTVQCVVTSPPFWGLRDYMEPCQLGLEPTPEEYVDNMVNVFRDVWRVLRDDGVAWLNLGDSYATGTTAERQQGSRGISKNTQSAQDAVPRVGTPRGVKTKDLIGIPWRVALALQADGWYLRSDIIWAKKNTMPESVRDRPTRSHEYIFLLTKNQRYYYDADAIKEKGSHAGPCGPGTQKTPHAQGFGRRTREEETARQDRQAGVMVNKRDVWHIATQPYPKAHYATFPEEIPRICILAGTKPGDIVLDPFAGSGTTGKVAIELGRKAVCMDISKQYANDHMKARMSTTIGFSL